MEVVHSQQFNRGATLNHHAREGYPSDGKEINMNDSHFTVENLILGTDNLDKMVREIRFVLGTLMRYVREEAVSHDGWNKYYNTSWRIDPWVIFPVGVGKVCLDHQNAGRIWDTDGQFHQPNVFHVLQVRKDLQILLDAVITRHSKFAARLTPFIVAASA